MTVDKSEMCIQYEHDLCEGAIIEIINGWKKEKFTFITI
jgi:hypothetical protein